MKDVLIKIGKEFNIKSELNSFKTTTMGHINSTFQVKFGEEYYTIQKINKNVFKDPVKVMNNIELVTKHIRNISPTESIELLHTKEEKSYCIVDGEYYRCYKYIQGVVYNGEMDENKMRASGEAFGKFQLLLADFDPKKLYDTIPYFHSTDRRYITFENAIKADLKGRVKEVQKEIDGYKNLKEQGLYISKLVKEGKIKLRVTHNDTKTNNIIFDEKNIPICVIDLDTVMPGLLIFDYGDSLRFGASTGAENEKDLSKVNFSLDLFKAYSEGFISKVAKILTKEELDNMALGALTMTFECGMRFLTDYLEGDTYFRIAYQTENLDRARTQLKLANEMSINMDKMNKIVLDIYNKYK